METIGKVSLVTRYITFPSIRYPDQEYKLLKILKYYFCKYKAF